MDCPTCGKPAEPGAVDCYRCGERLLHPGCGAPSLHVLSAVGGLGKALTVLLSLFAVGEAVQFAVGLAGGATSRPRAPSSPGWAPDGGRAGPSPG